ncbi:MAG TPA: hypothetical protein VG937_06430 [Polyangiaceae bacterium]|nr:hypothetical protein [Polyangiaceae bacterium]
MGQMVVGSGKRVILWPGVGALGAAVSLLFSACVVDADQRSDPDPLADVATVEQAATMCQNGSFRCLANTVQSCVRRRWVSTQTCATAALCNAASGSCTAPACNVGQMRCEGAQLQTCNAGRTGFTTTQTCAAGTQCNAASGSCTGAVCIAGQTQCSNATLQTCNPSQTGWINTQICASPARCSATAGCL